MDLAPERKQAMKTFLLELNNLEGVLVYYCYIRTYFYCYDVYLSSLVRRQYTGGIMGICKADIIIIIILKA